MGDRTPKLGDVVFYVDCGIGPEPAIVMNVRNGRPDLAVFMASGRLNATGIPHRSDASWWDAWWCWSDEVDDG